MNKLVYSPKAKDDLDYIFDYIASDNVSEAIDFIARIKAEIEKLADFPLIGTDQGKLFLTNRKMRFIVVGDYLIFYRFHSENDKVHILRVLHGAMNYETRIKEDEEQI